MPEHMAETSKEEENSVGWKKEDNKTGSKNVVKSCLSGFHCIEWMM